MQGRLEKAGLPAGSVNVGTFHGFCYKALLKRWYRRLGAHFASSNVAETSGSPCIMLPGAMLLKRWYCSLGALWCHTHANVVACTVSVNFRGLMRRRCQPTHALCQHC